MKKRLLIVLLVLLLTGCSTAPSPTPAQPAPMLDLHGDGGGAQLSDGPETVILATFFPVYTPALNIVQGADNVRLELLAPPTAGCLHDYQLTTTDRQKIERADIIIINGADMEAFLDNLLEGKEVIDTSQGYTLLPSAGEHAYNPHLWMSIDGAIHQAERIREGLMVADPNNAAVYGANGDGYTERLMDLQANMHATLAGLEGLSIVAVHASLAYFADEFSLQVAATLKEEPEASLSAKDLASAAQAATAQGCVAILGEEQYGTSDADTLAREIELPVLMIDTAVTGDLDNADSYLQSMDYNTTLLYASLIAMP